MNSWYNWYYYNELDINMAKETIDFLNERIDKIRLDEKIKDKDDRIKKLNQSIYALRYTYSLQEYQSIL